MRTRLTAEERSEQLIAAAVTAFSTGGYNGTTTDQVAKLAGVSQPYVIRLFGSKQALFIAAVEHAATQIEQKFREAAAAQPDLESLGYAYDTILAQRELVTVLLHGFTTGSDPALGPVVRRCFGRIYQAIRELTGAPVDEVRDFLAMGMLLSVLGALNVIGPDAAPAEPWMEELVGGIERLREAQLGPPASAPPAG